MMSVSAGAANLAHGRTAAFNVAETALTNALLGAIGILTGTIAARWLGPEGRGELGAIQLWPSALASVAMLGLPEALVYFSAKYQSESRRYLVTACAIALAGMPLFVAIGYVLMPRLIPRQSDQVIHAARVYLLLIPMYACAGLPNQLLRGIQRYRLWNAIRILPPVLWLVVIVVALGLRINQPVRLTTTYVVLLACVGQATAWIGWKNSAGPAAPTAVSVSNLVKFGIPSAVATMSQFFNLKLDQLMVAAAVPARELGVYMVAVAWGSCVSVLSSALALIVSPQIAASASDSERSRRFASGARSAAWLIAVPVVLLTAATPFGVTLVFGRDFQPATIPAMILVVASGVSALNGVLEELLRGYGRPSATLWAEATGVAVGLPALLLLLPPVGLTGAGLASLIGYLAATAVLLFQSRRFAGLRMVEVLDPRGLPWSNMSALTVRAVRLRFSQE